MKNVRPDLRLINRVTWLVYPPLKVEGRLAIIFINLGGYFMSQQKPTPPSPEEIAAAQAVLDKWDSIVTEFPFIGLDGCNSWCKLRRYGDNVFIASQPWDPKCNCGTSITNASELIATHISELYGIPIGDLVLIEEDLEGGFRDYTLQVYEPTEPYIFSYVREVSITAGWLELSLLDVAGFIEAERARVLKEQSE